MRSQPPYPHLCIAPFYIFWLPENVTERLQMCGLRVGMAVSEVNTLVTWHFK